jgi:hypothetical protein
MVYPLLSEATSSPMGAPEVNTFLSLLAVEYQVSALIQRQPLSALIFLSRDTLAHTLGWLEVLDCAKKSTRLAGVFTGRQ